MNDYKDLIERCKEILAWKNTGVLVGDELRTYADAILQNHLRGDLRQAENATASAAMKAVQDMAERIAKLESRLAVTENAPDGIACREMTIKMLEKRIKELEEERAEREKQEPVAWLDKSTEERPGDTVWLPGDLKGMDTSWLVPLYAAHPVTAPARLTDKQIAESHANEIMNCLHDPCDKSESVMPMPHDVNRFVRAIETAVLRANGFKVDNQ